MSWVWHRRLQHAALEQCDLADWQGEGAGPAGGSRAMKRWAVEWQKVENPGWQGRMGEEGHAGERTVANRPWGRERVLWQ